MNQANPPQSVRWQLLAGAVALAAIAILAGAFLAVPIRGAITYTGTMLGFGHEDADGEVVAVTDDSGKVQYYTCGMHPWVILPSPGDCPICHMALTPIDPNKFTGEITIDPVIVQNMGVRIAPVITGPLTKTIRTVGTIDYNERAVRDVNIKVGGWIEQLSVDYLGAKVERNDPLFELYSPQLYAAQEEYLLALRNADQIGTLDNSSARQGALDLLDAAQTRLEYFDITEQQIAELRAAGKPAKTMTIQSPHTGVVIEKHANEGMKVDPGMRVFRIADLSKVWVMVTLYEYQLPYVAAGQKATMKLPYIPGQEFEGEVLYIYPYLDKQTREVQVRLEFDNPADILKPGMFASVQLKNTLAAEKTLVPRSAIIDTGERQVAFVSLGEGKFEPRDVRLGIETNDGMVQIITGLKPGEMVVTSGQFLIDSEAKIREALAKMIKGDLASEQTVTAESAGTSELSELPPAVADKLNDILKQYFTIGNLLADDGIEGIAAPARQIAATLDEVINLEIPSAPHFWHTYQESIAAGRASALKIIALKGLAEARLEFAELSIALESLLMATGIPPSFAQEVQILHCPMYLEGQGGTSWLQTAGDVRNPYYGSRMLECFDERKALPITGSAAPAALPAENEPSSNANEPQTQNHPPLSAAAQARIDEIVTRYLALQQMLTEDQWENAAAELSAIRSAAQGLSQEAIENLTTSAAAVAARTTFTAEDLDTFRDGFFELSQALLTLVQTFPPSNKSIAGLHHAYCPMVKKGWLQSTREIRNPYATYMLDCGTIKQSFSLAPATNNSQQEEE